MEIKTWSDSKGLNLTHLDNRKYWQEVKQEIIKLSQ